MCISVTKNKVTTHWILHTNKCTNCISYISLKLFTLLYSYASLDCITVFFSSFLLLCIAVCLYYYSSNCTAQVAVHGNSVQLMFAAIGEQPELLGWALRHLAVVGPVSWW